MVIASGGSEESGLPEGLKGVGSVATCGIHGLWWSEGQVEVFGFDE